MLSELERIGLVVDQNDARVTRLLDEVKEREAQGFAYEAADASFELLARRVLGRVPDYFAVEKFDVTSSSASTRSASASPSRWRWSR